jgi:membrane protease YdiL (CAAX protease family)
MATLALSAHTKIGMPLKFIWIAFGWSWVFWIPGTLAERGLITLPIPAGVLEVIGGFGPLVAAFLLTAQTGGWPGLRALIGQAGRWRVNPIWYAVVLIGPFLYQLAGMALHVLLGGQPPAALALLEEVPGVLVNFVLAFFFIGLAEEMGWRGYALPRLQTQYSALTASLILGVIWALWHLPLFFNPGTSYSQTSFAVWLIYLLPYAILHTWLYNSSRGSLLLSIALHAMGNATGTLWMAVPDVGPLVRTTPGLVDHIYWMSAAVLWILAILAIVRTGALHLARQPRQVAEPILPR